MAIDAATVRRVAHLARIKTPEDRLEPLAAELNGILAWIEQLNEVDVAGVEPMTSNVAQPMRLRDDVVTDGDKVADKGLRLEAGTYVVQVGNRRAARVTVA
jgi:aspartyl-tRNA(Asn)/glutamyl-tRNA(Gln) amidotransferase subunit C